MYKKIIPIALLTIGFSLTGCTKSETKNDNTTEMTTQSSISNNINGVFDGYRYDTNGYVDTTQDVNYNNGYKITNPQDERFGEGMPGASNIIGNDNNKIQENIKEKANDIKDDAKSMYDDVKDGAEDTYNKIKDSLKS